MSSTAARPDAHARFEELFRAHHDDVLRYAARRLGAERAPDVVAETFLVAWQRLPDDLAAPLPWLYAIARRTVANHLRAGRRRARHELPPAADSVGTQPSEQGDQDVRREDALGALRRLRAEDREILMLVGWEGLDRTEVAEVLGCSPGTAGVRLYRARRRLEAAMAAGAGPAQRRMILGRERAGEGRGA